MNISIFDMLPVGERNALPRRELMQRTGLSDRQLRKQIEAERREGALILSSVDGVHGGYFRPEEGNAAELRRFIALMDKHARSTFYVLKSARAALAELERAEEAAQYGETIGAESISPLL